MENKKTVNQGEQSLGVKAFQKSLQVAFIALTLVIIGMVIWYFTFKGYFTIESQEQGLLLRFGKIVKVCPPGTYWELPDPVHSVIKIPTNQQIIEVNDFWFANQSKVIKNKEDDKSILAGRDGFLITADSNIVHTNWVVTYSIKNPKKYYLQTLTPINPYKDDDIIKTENGYLLGSRGPQTLIRNTVASSILRVTAQTNIENILYSHTEYRQQVEKNAFDAIEALDIGVKIDNIFFAEKPTPPKKTLPFFQKVTQARQESETVLTKAHSYKVETTNLTVANCAKIIAEAEAYSKRIVSEINAEKIYFESILEKHKSNPKVVLLSLYTDMLNEIFTTVEDKYIIPSDSNQEVRLKLNPEPDKTRDDVIDEFNQARKK